MRQQNLAPQERRFYAGKSAVAKSKGRDAHGRFVSGAIIAQQQEQARREKFGALLGSGFSGQPQGNGQPQQGSNAEERIQDMFGFKKMRR